MDVHRMICRRAASLLWIGSACLWTVVGACGGDGVTPPLDPATPDTAVSSISILPCACYGAWPCACYSYSGGPSPERTIGVLGTKVVITAVALAKDGTVLYTSTQNSGRFSWSSSAPDVATVGLQQHQQIQVTGETEGKATITVSSQGVTGHMTVTVQDRARLAWSIPLSGEYLDADITIGADGTIYVVTRDVDQSHWHAVSPRGVALWTLDLPNTFSTPAIGADGTLYAALLAGGLIAVSAEGTVRWTLWDLDGMRSSPAIGADGTIYVAGLYHVYAVDPQGKIRWAYETTKPTFAHSSPSVASDGTIYVGGTDGVLYAINSDGSLRWTSDTGQGNPIYSAPSIDRDGTIYFGSLHGLFSVSPDGSGGGKLLDRKVARSPSIGSGGAIYVGADWGEGAVGVFAFDSGGLLRWKSQPGASSTPILGADGTVYTTGGDPRGSVISALDSQGRLQWDYLTPGYFGVQSPAIGIDGAILALSRDPVVLFAIVEKGGANGGYAGAPWPTARSNRANTGRAGG